MFGCQRLQQVRSFEDDTSSRVLRNRLAEISQELAFLKYFPKRPPIMNGFFGQLNDRTGLDVTTGSNMVREASHGRAKGASLSVMICVNDDNRLLHSRIDDELSDAAKFFGIECKFRRTFRADNPKDVEPAVHHTHFNESIDPFILEQIVDVGLANACTNSRHHLVVKAILQAFHRLAQHAVATSPLIADDL